MLDRNAFDHWVSTTPVVNQGILSTLSSYRWFCAESSIAGELTIEILQSCSKPSIHYVVRCWLVRYTAQIRKVDMNITLLYPDIHNRIIGWAVSASTLMNNNPSDWYTTYGKCMSPKFMNIRHTIKVWHIFVYSKNYTHSYPWEQYVHHFIFD